MRIQLDELEGERKSLLRERERIDHLFHDKTTQIKQLQAEMQQLSGGLAAGWTQSVVETKAEAKCEGCHRLGWRSFFAQRPLLCGSCDYELGTEAKADLLFQEHTITCIHNCGRRRVQGWLNCCAGCPRGTHSAACNSNMLQVADKTFLPPPGQNKQPQPRSEDFSGAGPSGQDHGTHGIAKKEQSEERHPKIDERRVVNDHAERPCDPSAFGGLQNPAAKSDEQPGLLPSKPKEPTALPSITGNDTIFRDAAGDTML